MTGDTPKVHPRSNGWNSWSLKGLPGPQTDCRSTLRRRAGPLTVLGLIACALLQSAAPAVAGISGGLSADDVVDRADAIRFPQEPFQVQVTVDSYEGGAEAKRYVYRVLQRGNELSIVQTLAPAADRGQIMLSREGDLWVFLPSVSQPVRLPMSQRLTGQVANGDLARANFAGDYGATLLGEEDIDGRRHYRLELKAAKNGVTYERVLYWVDAENFRPHKAEFYTLSGRLMKTAVYDDFQSTAEGQIRPMRTTFVDALKAGERSVMTYQKFTPRDLPEKIFTKQYLKKLR